MIYSPGVWYSEGFLALEWLGVHHPPLLLVRTRWALGTYPPLHRYGAPAFPGQHLNTEFGALCSRGRAEKAKRDEPNEEHRVGHTWQPDAATSKVMTHSSTAAAPQGAVHHARSMIKHYSCCRSFRPELMVRSPFSMSCSLYLGPRRIKDFHR